MSDSRSPGGSNDANDEARGMPPSFKNARDSVEAYARPYRESTNVSVAIAHIHNAMRLGVRTEVLKELVLAMRELQK